MELPDITPQEGFDKLGFLRPNPTVGFQIPRFFFNVIQTVLSLTLSHLINKKIQVFFLFAVVREEFSFYRFWTSYLQCIPSEQRKTREEKDKRPNPTLSKNLTYWISEGDDET